MSEDNKDIRTFKYNMSFYYQSTIIYFIVFILYMVIRGEFVEDSFVLITKDPIIYLLGIIVIISLISLLQNLYKNKHMEISDNSISFVSRSKRRTFTLDQIKYIKLSKDRKRKMNRALKVIRIKLIKRRRPIIIRPYDYENENDLVKSFEALKSKLEAL